MTDVDELRSRVATLEMALVEIAMLSFTSSTSKTDLGRQLRRAKKVADTALQTSNAGEA